LSGSQAISNSGDFTSGQEFSIGGANTTGGPPGSFGRAVNGLIDEVRLSKAALEPTEFLNALLLDADFNNSGSIDGADFLNWQRNFPTNGGATRQMGDADGDGNVLAGDLAIWQSQYGDVTVSSAVVAVPEVSTFVLTVIGFLGLVMLW
jgi:hypothetical protein